MSQWKRQPLPCPKPGVYPDLDPETYHRYDAVNASLLKVAGLGREDRDWEAVRYWLRGAYENVTGAMHFGRAAHARLLEPEEYARKLVTLKKVVKPSSGRENILSESACPEVWGAAAEANPGRYILSPDMAEQVEAMTEYARRHERVSKLLELKSQRELTLIWDDDETGLRCKARLDWWIPGDPHGVLVDYKSSKSVGLRDLDRQIASLGWAFSLGFYLMGARKLLGDAAHSAVLICQRKEAPHAIRIRPLSPLAVDLAQLQARELLNQFAVCYAKDHWPSVSSVDHDYVPSPWELAGYPELTN